MHDLHQENHAGAITKKVIKHQSNNLVKDFVEYSHQTITKWGKGKSKKRGKAGKAGKK
jgi:hypothetical protein